MPADLRPKLLYLSLLLFCLLLTFIIKPASAGDWYVVPQVGLRGEYNSNINFSFREKQSDYIINLSPSVDFKYDSEISQLTGSLALNYQTYLQESRLDTLNQYYRISGQHKVAPRLAFNFSGGYTLDTTQAEELTASGLIINRSRRQALQASPGIAYNLSERASLQLGYAFNKVLYQDPRYTDYYTHLINLGLNYLLKNAKTTITGTILGRYTDYPSIGNLYRNLGAYAGLEHKFSEDWSLALSAGANFNWFSNQTAVLDFTFFPDFIQIRQVTEKTFTVSPFFNIAARRFWTKTNLTFGYRVDQSPSASGTVNQFHSGYAQVTYKFTERLSGALGGNLYYNTDSSPDSNYQNLTLYVNPSLTYKLTEKIGLTSSYTYGWRDDLVGKRTTERHLVWFSLSYAHPLHHRK